MDMGKRNFFTAMAIVFIAFWSCSTKPAPPTGQDGEGAMEAWKGLDDFHQLMAASFHPYHDSANVAPAKKLAGEIAVSASRWAQEKLPSRVDNDKVRQLLKDLESKAQALGDLVEVGDDPAIGESLTSLHDTFHLLQEAWKGDGK